MNKLNQKLRCLRCKELFAMQNLIYKTELGTGGYKCLKCSKNEGKDILKLFAMFFIGLAFVALITWLLITFGAPTNA